jgi:hypothetical protein
LVWAAISTISLHSGVDLDQNRQPVNTPVLSAWAVPENGAKECDPEGKSETGTPTQTSTVKVRAEETVAAMERQSVGLIVATAKAIMVQLKFNGSPATNSDDELD